MKEVLSDENIEQLRDSCTKIRDLAIIDLLASTGMRVGELVKLNREDINFSERECIVFGKGNKERIVYFNARAKIHLQQYLTSRKDRNKALFVSLAKPHKRPRDFGRGNPFAQNRSFGKKSYVFTLISSAVPWLLWL